MLPNGSRLESPYQAYQLYVAIKNHFHTNYDFFKYNGKVKTHLSSFETRRDKYFFNKLQKHNDPLGLLVSHFVDNPSAWIGDIVNPEFNQSAYLKWKKRQDSIAYTYKENLAQLPEDIDVCLTSYSGQHPTLLTKYIGNNIYPETVVLLNLQFNFFPYWNETIGDPVVWPAIHQKLVKYKPFIQFNKQTINKITVDYFGSVE
jgi:hypothetical protein